MNTSVLRRAWWRKLVFSTLGYCLRSRDAAAPDLPENPGRILVLAPVLRGDYIVLSPLINGLTKAKPHSEIGVVVTKASYELARVDPAVDKVLLYRKLPSWPRSIIEIGRYKPDIVVLPKAHPAFTESLLLLVCRAKYRVGLSHPHLDALLTHRVSHEQENEHRSEAFARLLKPFGQDPSAVSRLPHIGLDPETEKKAEAAFESWGKDHPWVSLNVSAGSPARIWPDRKWMQFVQIFHELRPDLRFLVLGTARDRRLCGKLTSEKDYIYTTPTRSFLEVSALISRTQMLISPDTGTVHAAAAHGVPTVVLYNSDRINYVRFAPLSISHRAVFADTDMDVDSISVLRVIHEAVRLLSETETDKA